MGTMSIAFPDHLSRSQIDLAWRSSGSRQLLSCFALHGGSLFGGGEDLEFAPPLKAEKVAGVCEAAFLIDSSMSVVGAGPRRPAHISQPHCPGLSATESNCSTPPACSGRGR